MIYLTNVYAEQSKHKDLITVISPWTLTIMLACVSDHGLLVEDLAKLS